MEAILYTQAGKESGKLALPEAVFGLKWNSDLVHQVTMALESSARNAIAHTKGRGEVRGGGKKPWKQKGTGRSRHGSIRSPIWKGGGITHGPTKEQNFDRKINKQVKVKALFTVLSRKAKDGELVFVDALSFAAPKTAEAAGALKNLAKATGHDSLAWTKGNRALVLVPGADKVAKKSFRNIPSVMVDEVRNINTLDLMRYKYLVIAGGDASVKMLADKAR